ncbi:MAG TPA: EipA family protein, partial [Erythrobacter sp.]|nr:EipA family protein [Erythrobacter sp.]
MKNTLTGYFKQIGITLAAGFALAAAPSVAQELQSIDPDNAYDAPIDGDLAAPQAQTPPAPADQTGNDLVAFGAEGAQEAQQLPPADGAADAAAPAEETATAAQGSETTYGEDDLIGAAEGVFGKGAEGLAKVIEDLLSKQGEPNAYIVGREAGGAFAIGVRYGSGTLHHKVEGNRPAYWTGPSIGFDAGANAGKTFMLVYNLYDSEELYTRFPAGE